MGGGGNQKWGGYSEPEKTIGPIPKDKGGTNAGYDVFGIPDDDKEPRVGKREKTEKEKKLEAWKKQKAQSSEAVAERGKKAQLKAMTPEQRAEHRASDKMWERHTKKEYSKWEKEGGTNHSEWLTKLEGIKKEWAKGGTKQWAKSNKKQAENLRDKARRAEAWKSRKK